LIWFYPIKFKFGLEIFKTFDFDPISLNQKIEKTIIFFLSRPVLRWSPYVISSFFFIFLACHRNSPSHHGGPSSLLGRFCFGPSIAAHLAHLWRRLLPSDAQAAATCQAGVAALCAAACRALLRAQGANPKSCPTTFLLPSLT
jgi:hypothetical protein